MFEQSIKITKQKSTKSELMRYKRKTKQNRKKWSILSCRKKGDVHGKEKRQKSKYT